MTGPQTILQSRIDARLKALRRTARDVSVRAGLKPDAIRTIISGRSKSPRGETLRALADELQCDVGYLVGQIDVPYAKEELRRSPSGTVRGVDKLAISGSLSADWKPEAEIWLEDDGEFLSNVYSLPDYLTGPQHLELVLDDHASPAVPKGAFVHVLALHGDLALVDRDVIVVQRQRLTSEGSMSFQRTCRRFRRHSKSLAILEQLGGSSDDDIRLEGPDLKILDTAAVPLIWFGGSPQAVEIEGVVLRSITVMSGPPVETGRVPYRDPARIPDEE